MSNATNESDPLGIDSQIDLLEYVSALFQSKYKIGAIALIGAVIVLGLTLLKDNIYTSSAVVAINTNEKPGGVAPKDFRTTNAIGLLEHDLIIEATPANERERMLARMRSVRFSNIFINENNLIPYIYHKHWDSEKKTWKGDFVPDKKEATSIFQESIRAIELDEKSGLLLIHFKTRDPELSAKLANNFVKRFNEYTREIALTEISQRRKYLEEQLVAIKNVELQKSIFRLLEAQLAAETLLYAKKDYPLEEIQPALPPMFKSSPKRLTISALSFIGFVFLGFTVVIGSILARKIITNLKKYQPTSQAEATITDEQDHASERGQMPDNWIEEKKK